MQQFTDPAMQVQYPCLPWNNVNFSTWQRYYDEVQKQYPDEDESRGLLPFGGWQIYDAMVAYAKEDDVVGFLCAAGIPSLYVGDSCQPLHISYLFNGDPDRQVEGTVNDEVNGGTKPGLVPYGKGVTWLMRTTWSTITSTRLFTGWRRRTDAAHW